MPRDRFHAASVDANLVVREVGLGAELGDGPAIEADTALADQLLGGTTGGDPRGREQLLQSLHGAILARRGGGVNGCYHRFQCRIVSVVAAILALGTGVLASPIPAAAQDTREEVIAAAQAEKEKTPPPATQSGAEHISELVGGVLTPKAHSFFPYFDSVYSGGGFTLGAGYGWLYGDHSNAAIRGLYSIKNYKLIEAVTTSSQHLDGKLTVGALVGWRDAPEAAFYGLGMDTALTGRANFDLSEGYGDVTAALRPTDWTLLAGSVGVEGYTIKSGKGEEPSIEEAYTPSTAPGLGDEPDLHPLAGDRRDRLAHVPGLLAQGRVLRRDAARLQQHERSVRLRPRGRDAHPARPRAARNVGAVVPRRHEDDARTTISCRTSCCRRSAAAARCVRITAGDSAIVTRW